MFVPQRLGPIALAGGMLLAGCGSSGPAAVPDPPLAQVLPKDYRVTHLWRRSLSGSDVPDVIVTAVGPAKGELAFHPATLQVLSWDKLAKRWNVSFDAQKAIPPESFGSPQTSNQGAGEYTGFGASDDKKPILDPEASGAVDDVEFGSLFGKRTQLVFSSTLNYGGSGVPGMLVVVDFGGDQGDIAYAWSGEGLGAWLIANGEVTARANYWTPSDAHCCPSREYRFAIAERDGYLSEVRDDRPYVGVLVREAEQDEFPYTGPVRVTQIADDAPAKGHLEVGDVIVDVANTPPRPSDDDFSTGSIFDKVMRFDSGQTAKLLVLRGGRKVVVPVRLGSLRDASADLYVEEGEAATFGL